MFPCLWFHSSLQPKLLIYSVCWKAIFNWLWYKCALNPILPLVSPFTRFAVKSKTTSDGYFCLLNYFNRFVSYSMQTVIWKVYLKPMVNLLSGLFVMCRDFHFLPCRLNRKWESFHNERCPQTNTTHLSVVVATQKLASTLSLLVTGHFRVSSWHAAIKTINVYEWVPKHKIEVLLVNSVEKRHRPSSSTNRKKCFDWYGLPCHNCSKWRFCKG